MKSLSESTGDGLKDALLAAHEETYLPRAIQCIDMLEQVKHLSGAVAEIGVHAGATTIALARQMKALEIDDLLYAFDTFKGHPFDDREEFKRLTSEPMLKGQQKGFSAEEFKHLVNELELDNIFIIIGPIETTAFLIDSNRQFRFVWVDVDLYDSAIFSYEFFKSRLISGGIIGSHDFKHERTPGIEIAVTELFIKDLNYQEIFRDEEESNIFFKKL
jgi:hypothetical protein